jgi:hypothetical protein
MLTVKFRHTGRDETMILSAARVEVVPCSDVTDCGGYSVEVLDGEGRLNVFTVSLRDEDYNVAFVEGATGATTQVVRPRVPKGG